MILPLTHFFESRDVRFNEEEFPFQELYRSDPLFDSESSDPFDDDYPPDAESEKVDNLISGSTSQVEDREFDHHSNRAHDATSSSNVTPTTGVSANAADRPLTSPGHSGHRHGGSNNTADSPQLTGTRQSKQARTQRDPGFFIDSSNLMIRSVTDISKIASNKIPVPRSVTEALSGPYAEEWSQAIQSELASHAENETWTLVDKPQNCNVIGSVWSSTSYMTRALDQSIALKRD